MTTANDLPQPRPRLTRRWIIRLGAGMLLAGLAIYLLDREVQWQDAFAAAKQVLPFWLCLSFLGIVANSIARALRWRLLFPADQEPPPRRAIFGVLMAGQLLNFVLPLRAGDLTRAYFMGRRRQASTAAAVGTIGAEKVLDLTIVGLLVAFVLPSLVLPSWLGSPGRDAFVGTVVGAIIWSGILLALPWFQRSLATWGARIELLAPLSRFLSRFLDGLAALRHIQRLPALLSWSAIVWLGGILANLFLMRALNLPATFLSATLVMLVIQGGVSVPLTPGQIGIFEALAVLALSLVSISATSGLAFGILLHFLVLVLPLGVGLPWLLRHF